MINIIKEKIDLSPELEKKIEWAKKYSNVDINIEKGTLIRLNQLILLTLNPIKLF